jgi:uncharacterized protein (UPF0335 family)
MSSFSDVPALHAGGAASDAARLQAELQDLQRERRQVMRAACGIGARAKVPRARTRLSKRPARLARASLDDVCARACGVV